jgi:hypothetical protein
VFAHQCADRHCNATQYLLTAAFSVNSKLPVSDCHAAHHCIL